MSTPYKRYISSAVCEGISKNGWPVVGVLFFFNIPPIYLFIYSSQYGGYYGENNNK
jgi:hypothetical protein